MIDNIREFTDTELLDWMQEQLDLADYTGRCIFRWSMTGRGWRLHETSHYGAVSSVRGAIEAAMIREKE